MKISVVTPSIRPNGLQRVREGLLEQTEKDFEWLVEINWTGEVDFNQSMNRLIRRSQGELIVSIQDYISPSPTVLEDFWKAYQEKDAMYTMPVGKKKDDDIVWDWRAKREGKCDWRDWEIDLGATSKKMLYEIGGFDEELDKKWGFDNVSVGMRADMKGYEVICLNSSWGIALDHDSFEPHPFREKRDPDFANTRMELTKNGLDIRYLV